MDINTLLMYLVFTFIGIILFLNVLKVFFNIFSFSKNKTLSSNIEAVDSLTTEVRLEVNKHVRPYLSSLENVYEKSASEKGTLGSFVFSIFEDKFSNYISQNKEMVESEICKCCSEYEDADCKGSFCLEGSGLSCTKV